MWQFKTFIHLDKKAKKCKLFFFFYNHLPPLFDINILGGHSIFKHTIVVSFFYFF